MLWDLFCRVVDNFGDIGVCWRAAADLASRGEQVRLWLDDPGALRWMAPQGRPGVQVLHWTADAPAVDPGDVVVEAFGCNPPDAFVSRMAGAARPPVWINLEYLSAESYVERSHGLPSPQTAGPGAGLTKWFYYPGFTPRTGGLLREPDLLQRWTSFDAAGWLATRGLARRPGERIVSLFCYANPALPALLDRLSSQPTLLLATAGAAAQQVADQLGPSLARGRLRAALLPHVTQTEFDSLLWASDLNFVRGEDSFVRAQWAGKPFVWHIYPQHDGAHAAKLAAFLDRFLVGMPAASAADIRRLWTAWNGLSAGSPQPAPLAGWQRHTRAWRDRLLAQPDLVTRLLGFVEERR
ncbi:MAG TPA: elongation factor P maturation arginine rhamnosyltransferase EarP [Albitalea sp.]|nr:elongation factor P maturation arginine rhamnosyltransferase EarP [Albitalea sp.]